MAEDAIIGMIFMMVLGGIGFLIGFFGLRSKRRRKALCPSKTTGVIFSVHKQRHQAKPQYFYFPEFSYTVNGISYNKRSDVGTSTPWKYSVGKELDVFYNPNNPDEHYVKTDGLFVVGYYVFLIVGSLFMILGLLIPILAVIES